MTQLTLKEYLEQRLNTKAEDDDMVAVLLRCVDIGTLEGNVEMTKECSELAIAVHQLRPSVLENFVLATDASKEQIENVIIEFYQSQRYKFVEKIKTTQSRLNEEVLILGYLFQKGKENRRVVLAYHPPINVMAVLKD